MSDVERERVLSIQGLTAGYGRTTVLHDVSLDLKAGEILAVVGANGAGKSTLLRSISGLTNITGGDVLVGSSSVKGASARRLARLGVAHVPENRGIFRRHSVEDNLRLATFSTKARRADVARLLERVYAQFPILGTRRKQVAGTMSGGEQQMLAIGMGLMIEPTVLMLDEPSLGLAPAIIRAVFREVVSLRDSGTSILLVEQRALDAFEIADRAIILKSGEITASGSPASLAGDDEVIQSYLGTRAGRPS